MNYFGYIVHPELLTAADAGQMIKASLSQMYKEGRFLGGLHNQANQLIYVDNNEGKVDHFTGREWIERNGILVYELIYHGGLIK